MGTGLDQLGRRLRRNEYLAASLVLAVLVLVFFFPLFSSHRTFSAVEDVQRRALPWIDTRHPPTELLHQQSDQATVYYPWEVFTKAQLDGGGGVPLWDPLSFAGHPLFANGQTGLAYPPRLLLAWQTSPTWTHDPYVMFHIWLGGLAMFALMREFGALFAGALLSGIAWSFSSYTAFWIQLENFAVVLALLPFVILFIHRWHTRRSWRSLAVASLLLGLVFIGGSPELSLICFYVTFGYAAALSATRLVAEWRVASAVQRAVVVSAPALLVAVATAVAAVAVLPFLELQSRAGRAPLTLSENLDLGPVGLGNLANTFIPPKLPLDAVAVYSRGVFVGTIAALLAVVGVVRRRPGAGLARGVLVAVVLFLAARPVAWLAYNAVPKFSSVLGLGRTLFVWDFAVAILAGLGLDAVIKLLRRHQTPNVRRFVPVAVGAVCIGLTATQLLVYARDVNPPLPRRVGTNLFPSTPALDAARRLVGKGPGRGRVIPMATTPTRLLPPVMMPLPGATGMALDLPSVGGYDSVVPQATQDIWRVIAGASPESVEGQPIPGAFWPTFRSRTRLEALDRVGVAAVLASPDTVLTPAELDQANLREAYRGADGVVYEIGHAPGRAVVVDSAVRAGSRRDALHRFVHPDFDVRREVILEGGTRARGRLPAPAGAGSGSRPRTRWVTDDPNALRIEVASPRAGWLVVLDSWDPGWNASVNGRPTEIERADFNFRAVRVPAGASVVNMSYRPPGLVAGATVSAVTVALIVALLILPGVRRLARRRSAVAERR